MIKLNNEAVMSLLVSTPIIYVDAFKVQHTLTFLFDGNHISIKHDIVSANRSMSQYFDRNSDHNGLFNLTEAISYFDNDDTNEIKKELASRLVKLAEKAQGLFSTLEVLHIKEVFSK